MDTQEPQEQVVKSVEELTAEVEKLTKELEFAKSENERVTRWWNDLERKKETRIFYIGFSYKFETKKMKEARERRRVNEEEVELDEEVI